MESFYGGRPGAPFIISKTYPSSAVMETYKSEIGYGQYVLIDATESGGVETEHGNLYQKNLDGSFSRKGNIKGVAGNDTRLMVVPSQTMENARYWSYDADKKIFTFEGILNKSYNIIDKFLGENYHSDKDSNKFPFQMEPGEIYYADASECKDFHLIAAYTMSVAQTGAKQTVYQKISDYVGVVAVDNYTNELIITTTDNKKHIINSPGSIVIGGVYEESQFEPIKNTPPEKLFSSSEEPDEKYKGYGLILETDMSLDYPRILYLYNYKYEKWVRICQLGEINLDKDSAFADESTDINVRTNGAIFINNEKELRTYTDHLETTHIINKIKKRGDSGSSVEYPIGTELRYLSPTQHSIHSNFEEEFLLGSAKIEKTKKNAEGTNITIIDYYNGTPPAEGYYRTVEQDYAGGGDPLSPKNGKLTFTNDTNTTYGISIDNTNGKVIFDNEEASNDINYVKNNGTLQINIPRVDKQITLYFIKGVTETKIATKNTTEYTNEDGYLVKKDFISHLI